MIKRPYFKLPLFRGDPTYFILTALSQSDRVQNIKERNDQVHLPIMHWSNKRYIPLKNSIKEFTSCVLRLRPLCTFNEYTLFIGEKKRIPLKNYI